MTMSIGGLVSGMDTSTLISQLISAERAPQKALEARLKATKDAASAYRTVNTTFLAVSAAAEGLTAAALTSARKANSSDPSVTTSATAGAVTGSRVTFTVQNTAATQTLVTHSSWASPDTKVRDQTEPGWPIEVRNAATNAVVGTVDVGQDATLADAAAAINAAKLGLTASVIKTDTNTYRLQLTSEKSGEAGAFVIASGSDQPGFPGSAFDETSPGQDAVVSLGGSIVAKSATNTFTDLIEGVSFTVSKGQDTPVTISVGDDVDGVTAKVQSLVDAVNAAMKYARDYTSNSPGSDATLKGDYSVSSLGGRLMDAVSFAVPQSVPVTPATDPPTFKTGFPADMGFTVARDGRSIAFDKAKFQTALRADPATVQRLVGGTPTGAGTDAILGTRDDVAATGIAGRLLEVAKAASNSTTGSLVTLAKGQESLVKGYQDRIAAWDLRLEKRREMLTRQFTAMETALSGLRNQSTWLAGQINSLPSYS